MEEVIRNIVNFVVDAVLYLVALYIIWDFILARIFGVSIYTILGVKYSAGWLKGNFGNIKKPSGVGVVKPTQPKTTHSNFYDDA